MVTTVHNPSQKSIMQWCDNVTGGDPQATIDLYAEYDEQGLAPRESNMRPLSSHEYAVILHHTAIKLGWI